MRPDIDAIEALDAVVTEGGFAAAAARLHKVPSAVNYQIILTKVDKVKPTALTALIEATATELKKHVAAHPDVLATSAADGTGIAEARAALSELAKPE